MPNQELFPGWAFCIFSVIFHYKSLELWGYRWICGVSLDLWGYRWIYGLSLELWVIVGFMRNNITNTQNRPLCSCRCFAAFRFI